MAMPTVMEMTRKKNPRESPLDPSEINLGSCRLLRTTQTIVTEKMTGHGHLRAKRTINKIRRKVQGVNGRRVGEIETRGGNDTEGLSLNQPDVSDKTPRSRITSST